MEQLEALHESSPKAVGFVERKVEIPSHTLYLYGPSRSGKTWLLLDHLARLPKKKRLYIDLRDLRIDRRALAENLQPFVDRHGIETVAIDHWNAEVPPPRCRQVILAGETATPPHPMMPTLEVPPLDFEEYLAFERRHVHLEHSFSLFLRTGTLPQMATVHESLLTMHLHETVRSLFPLPNERILFAHLALHLGKPVTAHQLYTAIKKEHRVSKDWLYKTLKSWEERGLLRWMEKAGQPRAPRRLAMWDFAAPASMRFEKSLMGQLASLGSWHLLGREEEAFYTDHIDFLLPESRHALMLSPFSNPQIAAARVARAAEEIDRFAIERITILTVANRFDFTFETRPVTARPFYEWIME